MRGGKSNTNSYKSNIWKSYIYGFLKKFTFFSGVLIPMYTLWGHISFAQIMILQAIYLFAMFLLEIPTGVVADKFGRKISLVLGSLVIGIAVLIYGSYASFGIFILGEILFATGSALISGADSALMYDSLKINKETKKSKKVFAREEIFGLLGIMIAAPIGSFIAKSLGMNWPMLLTAVPMFVGVIIALTFKEPPVRTKKEERDYFKILKTGMKYFKNHKILRILTRDYAIISVLSFFMIWVYQVVLQTFNFPIQYYGFIHATIVLAEILVLNSVLKIEGVLKSKKKYILFASLLVGVCYLLLAFASNIYLVIAGILLIGGFGMTMKPIFYSYMNKYAPSSHRATVLSAVSMTRAIAGAITNVIFGYLVDWNLKYTLIFLGVLTIFFALISRVEEKHLKE